MAYSTKVIEHYENPRNVGTLDKSDPSVGTGLVGAPACGDVMRLQIRVNEQGVIEDAKFKTFGCGSAIASSSLATEWIKGKTVEEAEAIKNSQIVDELSLPPVKIHCSVLAEDAIKSAIADYRKKHPSLRPSFYAAQAYDGVQLINSAVVAVGGDTSKKDAMKAEMEKADFKSLRGSFRYGNNHIPVQNFYLQDVVKDASGDLSLKTVATIVKDDQDRFHDKCPMK